MMAMLLFPTRPTLTQCRLLFRHPPPPRSKQLVGLFGTIDFCSYYATTQRCQQQGGYSSTLGDGAAKNDCRFFSSSSSSKADSEQHELTKEESSSTSTPHRSTTTTASDLQMSLFKNPIVQRLWAERQQAKQGGRRQSRSDETSHEQNTNKKTKNTPSSSRIQVSYPFSTDSLLFDTYKNPWGQIRLGKVLEDLDALAGNIAFFHVQRAQQQQQRQRQQQNDKRSDSDSDANETDHDFPVIVTASVDRIRLRRQPLVECDQFLSGQVTWTGRSSMEIKMCCSEEPQPSSSNDINDSKNDWLEAYVTFVTLDPHTKKPMAIPPIEPETPKEIQEFQDGERRALLKKKHRQQQQLQKQQHSEEDAEVVRRHARIETMAQELLMEASPLLNLPSLANPHDILMDQTAMQNAMVAQPQVQNLHNRIFGGFLMRRALELAFATVYCFAGARPVFLEVDQVSFTLPVDVGDLLIFRSHILYTDSGRLLDFYEQQPQVNAADNNKNNVDELTGAAPSLPSEEQDQVVPLVHIEVEANVTVPEEAKSQVSNLFHFTFGIVPKKKEQSDQSGVPRKPVVHRPIRRVLPSNIEQARRMASRMVANEEQAQLDQSNTASRLGPAATTANHS